MIKKSAQNGFTLIELMIVVAIIGILAAIAVPAYQDYTIRSKISEALATVASCKASVSEYFQSNTALPPTLAASGCSSVTTQYVSGLDVASGAIQVTLGNVGGSASFTVIEFAPTVSGTYITGWTCNGAGTSLPSQYRPAVCR